MYVAMYQNRNNEWPSWWRIVALCSTILAVEFAYAVEAGYAVPTLLKTGLRERYASLMWSAGPILGIIFQGYLGTASDKCTSVWGRRRPFILLIGIIVLVALGLFPYGSTMAGVLAMGASSSKLFVIAYTSSLFISMDFSLDAIQSPSRSFLLDSLSEDRTHKGNLIYSTMMGLGATLGSLISAIPWKKFEGEFGSNFETQTKVVFGFSVLLFSVCMLATICSVNENKTRALKGFKSEQGNVLAQSEDTNFEKSEMSCSRRLEQPPCCRLFYDPLKDFCNSFYGTFTFAKNMSLSFFCLWILMFLSFSSLHSFYLFFTEYVGSVIYGGVANTENLHLQELYDEGVLVGCACLVLCNGVLFGGSVLLDPVMSYLKINLMTMTLAIFLSYLIAVAAAMVFPNLFTAVLIAPVGGLYYSVLASLPFTLISQYNSNGLLLRSTEKCSESSIGRAVSFLFIAVFAAQFLLGLCMGLLIELFGTSRVIIITSFVSHLLATGFLIWRFIK